MVPTLLYDAIVMGDSTVPKDLVTRVDVPTLVLAGSETGAWAANSATALKAALPNGHTRTLEGQNHAVQWDVLASEIREFFDPTERRDSSPLAGMIDVSQALGGVLFRGDRRAKEWALHG